MSIHQAEILKTLQETENGVLISILVQPGAKKTQIIGVLPSGDNHRSRLSSSLKIKIHALPVDGKANEELIRFLADIFQISKSKISIFRGPTSRVKVLSVSEYTVNQIAEKLMCNLNHR